MTLKSINPANEELLKEFTPLTETQIDQALDRAVETFQSYYRTSFAERSQWMLNAAEILESGQEKFGRLMTT